jgi:hypothetical protein
MEGAVTNPQQSALSSGLQSAIEACEETLELLREAPNPPDDRLLRVVVLAAGAFETALSRLAQDHPQREASLLIAATLGAEAANLARELGVDEPMVRCGGACDRAALLCEAAVAGPQRD